MLMNELLVLIYTLSPHSTVKTPAAGGWELALEMTLNHDI